MHGLLVEKHSLQSKPVSRCLAQYIRRHGPQGKIAIVTDKPEALLAATRKQWLKLIRQVKNERSSTLITARVDLLTQQIAWMQSLSFTSKAPDDQLEADITFATADDFVRVPPVCRIVYITYTFEREKLHMLTSWMPRNSLVVIYE
jgi:hypothetical protein